jgi:nucleotide-binding universal stress UspA family protein
MMFDRPSDDTRSGRIQTIVLATDLGPGSEVAAERAIDLSRGLDARLVCINVVDRRRLSGVGRHERYGDALPERVHALASLVRRARTLGVEASYLTWSGDPATGILDAADAEAADLIVVGTDGHDRAGHIPLGSVSDRLIHDASVSVLVVRGRVRTQRDIRPL